MTSFKHVVLHESFSAYCEDPLFRLNDTRLHIGLVPIPYMGNLSEASIFLLMLNPGLHPVDYFSEERFNDYRDLLIDNLHQKNGSEFLCLDPRWSWHSGGQYWLGKFQDLAVNLSSTTVSFKDVLKVLAQQVACVELMPYHSPSFHVPNALLQKLASVQLVQRFAKEDLWPRALRGEILLVVTRQVGRWGLTESRNVILYSSAQARGGHISTATLGGQAILKFLRSKMK